VSAPAAAALPGIGEAPSLTPDTILLLQAAHHEDPEVARRSWGTLVQDTGGAGPVIAWACQGAVRRLLPALGQRAELLDLPETVRATCRDATVEA
jgi:hypothetical protein